jgi:hypothetical protein
MIFRLLSPDFYVQLLTISFIFLNNPINPLILQIQVQTMLLSILQHKGVTQPCLIEIQNADNIKIKIKQLKQR